MALLDPDSAAIVDADADSPLPPAGQPLRLIPVEHNPFPDTPSPPLPDQGSARLIPVEHNPFPDDWEDQIGEPAGQAIASGAGAVASALKPDFPGAAQSFLGGEYETFNRDWSKEPLIGANPQTGELTGRLPALADIVGSGIAGPVPGGGAGVVLGAGPRVGGSLFDYSRLAEVPDVPQFDLPRVVPARGVPERTIATMTNPENIARVEEAVRQGAELGGPAWYGTQPLREAFGEVLGSDEGDPAFRQYMKYVGASSPRSNVPANARNASYYYGLERQGIAPPQLIKGPEGGMGTLSEALPPPYGHMAQRLHVQNVQNILDQGGMPVLQNPKPPSFTENLIGNQQPLTADVHNVRLWGLTDSMGRPVDVPAPNEYGYIEQQEQEMARRMGMSTAQFQASAWLGGAAQTGMKSGFDPFLRHFENRVNFTAQKRGETPIETLRKMITGEAPLLSLGAAAVPGAGLAAALAAQPAGVDQPPSD